MIIAEYGKIFCAKLRLETTPFGSWELDRITGSCSLMWLGATDDDDDDDDDYYYYYYYYYYYFI